MSSTTPSEGNFPLTYQIPVQAERNTWIGSGRPRHLCAAIAAFLLILSTHPIGPHIPALAQSPSNTLPGHVPLLRFARSEPRPQVPQGATHVFTLRPIELRTADDRRVGVEGIVVHLRIDDRVRFERAFSHLSDKLKSAADRIQVGFEEELRRVAGRLTLPQLAAFDPFALLNRGTRLRRLLDKVGLAIGDLNGEAMGYRARVR